MPVNKITIVVGFDQVEAVAYHTFCQSVLEKSTIPVQFIPLSLNTLSFYKEMHIDGSNKFIYSRFLTPYLCDFQGRAIYADGDMVCNTDISELVKIFDDSKAVQLVKHDYHTKYPKKYLGNKNENYPRKNWSSLIFFNCQHPANKILTPEFIQSKDGKFLHRFSWLKDEEIGELEKSWNYLAIEYDHKPKAKLIHYTLGTPCFKQFKYSDMSDIWWKTFHRATQGINK